MEISAKLKHAKLLQVAVQLNQYNLGLSLP